MKLKSNHWQMINPRLLFVSSLFLFFSGVPPQMTKPVFGVALGYNQMNEYYTLVAYQKVGTNLINKRILRRDQFIYYFSGFYPSKYNPNGINYFDKYRIWGGVFVDSISHEKIPYCPALDSLWKLKYAEFPTRGGIERYGWSNGELNPSGNQMSYLKQRYHINDLNNSYIIDTNFIQLLRDMTDSLWVVNYKALN